MFRPEVVTICSWGHEGSGPLGTLRSYTRILPQFSSSSQKVVFTFSSQTSVCFVVCCHNMLKTVGHFTFLDRDISINFILFLKTIEQQHLPKAERLCLVLRLSHNALWPYVSIRISAYFTAVAPHIRVTKPKLSHCVYRFVMIHKYSRLSFSCFSSVTENLLMFLLC